MLRVTLVCLLGISAAAGAAEEFPHDRLFDHAEADPRWAGADLIGRIELVRDFANSLPIASDPFSDRYTITYYGGPIDWVHFLNLAIFILSEDQKFGQAQFDQWKAEGGPDFEAGHTDIPTACTTDDLPSNALGALFGRDLLYQQNVDLRQQLTAFVNRLKPVPDKIAKQYSRDEIVLGLTDESSRKDRARAHAWFTAEPVNLTPILAKAMNLAEEPSGELALLKAGFRIEKFQGKRVIIERLR